ncbi:hypothetical protein M5D96_014237 [Drosophila gunungcola]|uniref:Uncharacterized protein n=1 Tax=Drosophila gunungcola TaxID=103775 RepID=A0A9P9Y9S5_9MUSC|nr:hypothetical protein M5D96_014237 [Drosophila gunungcola]
MFTVLQLFLHMNFLNLLEEIEGIFYIFHKLLYNISIIYIYYNIFMYMNVIYYRYSLNHITIICSENYPYIWLPANRHSPIYIFGHAVLKLHVYSTTTLPSYEFSQFT